MKNNYVVMISLLVAFFYLSSGKLEASGTAGVSGADFLDLGIGARALAMGGAFTAQTNDLSVLYYNPAGLGSIQFPVLSLQHQELITDSRFESISAAYPLMGGYLAASNSVFWVPPFERVDINGNSAGDVTFMNGAFTAGYGYDFEFMYAGASIKYIYQKIDSMFVNSAAIDLGVLKGMYLYSPFEAPVRNFHLGLSVLNLGTGAGDDPLPRRINLGLSYKLTHWLSFNTDVSESLIDFSDLYDFTYGFDESLRVKFGLEVTYLDLIALRCGYRINDGGSYSAGMGFNYAIKNVAFSFDTSYEDAGIFGPNYSINLTFKLIPKVITYEDRVAAERHYRNGIRFFVANDLDTALREFKTARDYDPYYRNIDKKIDDLQEIKQLMNENIILENEIQNQR